MATLHPCFSSGRCAPATVGALLDWCFLRRRLLVPMPDKIRIRGMVVEPGRRQRFDLPVARLPTQTWLSLPIEVVNGVRPGPNLWLSAAVHGDELNGVEIIRRVLQELDPADLGGAVIAVPIVNVFGFINQSRYLPDRRDLNRSFPGSATGSMAARLAHLFMTEVVQQCSYGIDLHTGSLHRSNLPQIRANFHDEETLRCAEAFAPPVLMHSELRDGSLRQAASQLGKHVLLYEAGEPLRFDEDAIELGVRGVLRVMAALGMGKRHPRPRYKPQRFDQTTWIRGRRAGILRLKVRLGETVQPKQSLGFIADAFGENSTTVRSPAAGRVIGVSNNPLVGRGDAIIHLGLNE